MLDFAYLQKRLNRSQDASTKSQLASLEARTGEPIAPASPAQITQTHGSNANTLRMFFQTIPAFGLYRVVVPQVSRCAPSQCVICADTFNKLFPVSSLSPSVVCLLAVAPSASSPPSAATSPWRLRLAKPRASSLRLSRLPRMLPTNRLVGLCFFVRLSCLICPIYVPLRLRATQLPLSSRSLGLLSCCTVGFLVCEDRSSKEATLKSSSFPLHSFGSTPRSSID